jgi:hypothetical protein
LFNPGVNLGDDIILSSREQAELDAGGNNLIYLWSTGETTQKIIVNNLVYIHVTVTNSDHCSASDSVTVTVLVSTTNMDTIRIFNMANQPQISSILQMPHRNIRLIS